MPSHESGPTLAAPHLPADLIAEAGGELSDRDLAVLGAVPPARAQKKPTSPRRWR